MISRTPAWRSSDLVNHLYNCRPNWNPQRSPHYYNPCWSKKVHMRYVLIISALRAETYQSAMFWPRELLWLIMICKEGSVNMPEHQVENLSHRSHLICMQHNSPIQCYDIRCLLKVNSYRPIRVSNAAIYKLIQQDLCPFFLSFVFFGSPLCTRYYNFLMFSIIVFKLGFYHWLGQYKHLLHSVDWLYCISYIYCCEKTKIFCAK